MSLIGRLGPTPGAGAAAFSRTSGRIAGAPSSLRYPSPFFDLAHTYLPKTHKQLFWLCRYYFLTHPLINAAIAKMSEYPTTEIVIEHEDPEVVNHWRTFLEDQCAFRPFQISCALDRYVQGNSLVGISYPFEKYITCASCRFTEQARRIRKRWRYAGSRFLLDCPRCGERREATAQDQYMKNASGIGLIRWNVENVEIEHSEFTGKSSYYYRIPRAVGNDITMGKQATIETIPQIFIEAHKKQKAIRFSRENIFHLRRESLSSGQSPGWGTPLLFPVLKDTFYLQLMKKAQESLLLEHIVPLRVLFPQAGSGSSDPFTNVDLTSWRSQIAQEIARWRQDPSYIPILPLPIGQQTLGGDGRALLITQEILQWSEQIIAGLGVPREFVMGGLTWSGSNVSLRMLENQFLRDREERRRMLKWVIERVAAFMGWPVVSARFKKFKMADDLQQKQFLFQLNQAQKVSDTTLLSDSDLDQREEDKTMIRETSQRLEASKKQQLAMAEIQAESQLLMTKTQQRGEEKLQQQSSAMQSLQSPLSPSQGPAGTPGGSKIDLVSAAQTLAERMLELPPDHREQQLEQIEAQSPELAELVRQFLEQMEGGPRGGGAQAPAPARSALAPLPEQRAPRRQAAVI